MDTEDLVSNDTSSNLVTKLIVDLMKDKSSTFSSTQESIHLPACPSFTSDETEPIESTRSSSDKT